MIDAELIENLRKLSGEHEKHLSTLREKIRIIDSAPKAKALVGKCFKYQSGGTYMFGGKSKGWIFKHIVAADAEHVFVNSFVIEGPLHAEFSFYIREYYSSFTYGHLIQISKRTYDKKFKKLMQTLAKIKKRGIYGK